ncbi:pdxT [Symbiodinium natans]|uniref:glutaminase n=1 Tax=Symbiodinium natans TaxID=878477 RepID=A0A812I372_9DINO|nr:pdxT [Symbiodinium natans]
MSPPTPASGRTTLGILALQGAFEEHEAMFKLLPTHLTDRLNIIQVRKMQELDSCDALVIPGGESTTMKIIAGTDEFMKHLRAYVRGGAGSDGVERRPHPVWGTCAGCILLSEDVVNSVSQGDGPQIQPAKRCKYGDPIGGLDVATCRNFFGRQAESFEAAIESATGEEQDSSPGNGSYARAVVQAVGLFLLAGSCEKGKAGESEGVEEDTSTEQTSFTRERAFSGSSEHEHDHAVEVAKTATTATRRTTRTTRSNGLSRRITEKMIDDALLDEKAAGVHVTDNFGAKAAHLRRTLSQSFDPDQLSCWRKPFFAIVRWPGFDSLIGIVILLNGMTIGFDTQAKAQIPIGCDENCNDCPNPGTVCQVTAPWVGYLDNICYGIYIAELLLRFLAFGPRAIKSHWVKFDLFLVATATVDLVLKTTALDAEFLKQVMLVRLLRLARLARLVRLVVQFQTLWKLVSGLMSCANTLFWTFLLISILSYIAALFGMDMITYDLALPPDHPYNIAVLENFGALDDAMFTLMQLFTFDSIASIYRPLIRQRPLLFFYFMTVLLVLSIALMNLVTAIMVEGALTIAEEDKEVRKTYEQARKKRQMAQLRLMFEELDEDGSGEVTLDEIMAAPEDVKQSLFEIAGTEDIQTLFEMLDFDGGGSLETDEFCQGVFKASSSSKPLELDRLMKQCRDILMNSRKAQHGLADWKV